MSPSRLCLLACFLIALAACEVVSPSIPDAEQLPSLDPISLSPGEKLNVVATTNLIGDVIANIAGEHIQLSVLIAPGQDPHTFEPAPRAIAAVEGADVIFVNGFGFEEILLETIANVAAAPIVPVSAGIQPMLPANSGHGSADPHVWFTPANGAVWAENIYTVLSTLDPAHAPAYQTRLAAYLLELDALDGYIRSQVERIPLERRKLISDHEIFTYFAAEYGFEVIGALIPSASTSAGSSPADLAALIEIIRRTSVPAVFVSASAGEGIQRLATSLSDEVGVPFAVVPLLTGSLPAPGHPGDTYLGYLRYNIDQIVSALLP